ncbi:MAG TPA: serine hydrolase domain-containing protein [Thermoanaerobaculia bacterium]|nr:serine hydrolase domain-containing protein [Thermoanaerobaculia bacterium]
MNDGALDRLPRTREAIEAGIRERLHLGAQLYVSLGGEPVADAALGENRPGEPLTRDHLMLWLSSTKPVPAVAIAQLWERGLLELDDPVALHVPEFAANGKEGITLRHLLTHTGGIRMLDTGWPHRSWEEIIAKICAMKPEPRWVPGQKAGYHQASSWFILGEVIRRVGGLPFSTYVRREIFEPLGMADSWIGMPTERYLEYWDAGRIGAMWATEENREGEELKDHGWDSAERVTRPSPGGNGYGPMRELGRFYEMLLGRGSWRAQRILLPQTVEAFTTPHRVGMVDVTFKHMLDWGLGFIVNSVQYGAETVPYGYGHHASPRTFGHSGYRSSTGFADPERGLAVALAFNGTPSNERHEVRIRSVLDAIYEDLGLA